ncbi:MAG: hypothetical protein KGJ66_15595 [Alphaproteobacteria bacterium]|nr:hypothetical protein [Alphaproteobacteria bacterium]
MRKHLTTYLAAAAAIALLAAPAFHARASSGDTPMMGQGAWNMMGGGSMMDRGSGNTMGGMMGMMNMMGQMNRMAENCNAMMASMTTSHGMAPNQQWKATPPQTPERHD